MGPILVSTDNNPHTGGRASVSLAPAMMGIINIYLFILMAWPSACLIFSNFEYNLRRMEALHRETVSLSSYPRFYAETDSVNNSLSGSVHFTIIRDNRGTLFRFLIFENIVKMEKI